MAMIDNTRKPERISGRIMVAAMNFGHSGVSKWGLSFLKPNKEAIILDIGCGGGANIKRMLRMCPSGKIYGVDYSDVSVAVSKKKNKRALETGHCDIIQADVIDLPFPRNNFDAVTAFETIYFWPDLVNSFRRVFDIVKPGGIFLICNEVTGEQKGKIDWEKKIKGMTIYTPAQITDFLSEAGFIKIDVKRHGTKSYLCVIGSKPH